MWAALSSLKLVREDVVLVRLLYGREHGFFLQSPPVLWPLAVSAWVTQAFYYPGAGSDESFTCVLPLLHPASQGERKE